MGDNHKWKLQCNLCFTVAIIEDKIDEMVEVDEEFYNDVPLFCPFCGQDVGLKIERI